MNRKIVFILALSSSLVVSLIAIITDEDLRDRMGYSYWVVSLAIIACILLVLAGYVADHTLVQRIKTLRESAQMATRPEDHGEDDHDEIIGLARKIERMARSLQQVEASYRGIVEDQVDLICRYRPDGKLTFANATYAAAFGRKRTELNGQPFPLFPTDITPSEEPATFERELAVADGRRLWLLWTQRPIKDETGTVVEYQAVGHDITVRKEAEAAMLRAKEAAEAADRAKSEFLAIVSHEIRTPINGVVGFARMLTESELTPDQREQVDMIQSSGLALEKLISDILDLSKIEAGKIEVEQAPFSPQKCVEEVCAFFAPRARASAVTLDFRIDSGVPAIVNSDEARVRQILTNLIGNALKFTERGGVTVQVGCTRGESIAAGSNRVAVRISYAVTDTGIGIPPEKIPQLFKPFSQVDSSSKRRRSGTGLGLIISRRLCELMGGTISVESRAGEGSTFTVLLPSAPADSAVTELL